MKKLILTTLVIVSMVMLFVVGFFAGMIHTVTDCEISTDDGYYLLEIDGQLFAHYAE